MPSSEYLHSLKFLVDHEKTQELLGRYVEILHNHGDAEAMYPDVAVHLSVCHDCRGIYEDLFASASLPDEAETTLRQALIDRFAGMMLPRSPIDEPPLNLLFREAVILRVAHIFSEGDDAGEPEFPPAGYLLFYDTLAVVNLDLVALFTLHHGEQPGLYRIEGIVFPEQTLLRFKASIQHDMGAADAHIENNRLVFSDLPLGQQTSRVIVTLEGFTRWNAG